MTDILAQYICLHLHGEFFKVHTKDIEEEKHATLWIPSFIPRAPACTHTAHVCRQKHSAAAQPSFQPWLQYRQSILRDYCAVHWGSYLVSNLRRFYGAFSPKSFHANVHLNKHFNSHRKSFLFPPWQFSVIIWIPSWVWKGCVLQEGVFLDWTSYLDQTCRPAS